MSIIKDVIQSVQAVFASKTSAAAPEQPKAHFREFGADTQAVRAGIDRSQYQENSEALYLTSSYVFKSAKDAAELFSGEQDGYTYSRYGNPTVSAMEERLAALEGAEACVASASGMSAILATVMALLKSGDHIVASRGMFGATQQMLGVMFSKFGIQATFVPATDLDAYRAAVTPQTKMFFVETPSNPLLELVDIAAVAKIAHDAGALFVVDNSFCSPALQRPLDLGADIVVHSTTKYLDGQGRTMGGATLGKKALMDEVTKFLRTAGPCISPFNAWVVLKGMETLRLRMNAHCENALALAQWLEQQPNVARVYYPGLASHPQHELAKNQQKGFGAVVSFEVKGGREEAWKVIDATRMISITSNLGDTKTTITHPATTSHGRVAPADREAAGIHENLLRVAVGLESLEDIKADLARGLA